MSQAPGGAPRLVQLYEQMLLIRKCEERLANLFKTGRIPGFIHLSIGQEATAVGVGAALRSTDTMTSTHRGHGHALAKGMSPVALFQEILGNEEGPCRGRGGSLHVADFSVGMLGANGIVAGGVAIALGSALSHKILNPGRVAVTLFGDGALATGVLYESMNLARLWAVPLLFVCENNGWSEFSPSSTQYGGSLSSLAQGFQIPYSNINGNDVEAVASSATELVEELRKGGGPAVIECRTRRALGHYAGDPQAYRKGLVENDVEEPIELALARMANLGVAHTQIEQVNARVQQAVDDALAAATNGHAARFEDAVGCVYA